MINGILTKALSTLLEQKLKGAGKVADLDFDRKAGLLFVSLQLVEENEQVSVKVMGLMLSEDGKLSFRSAESNREWIASLLNAYANRLTIEISDKYLPIVKPLFSSK